MRKSHLCAVICMSPILIYFSVVYRLTNLTYCINEKNDDDVMYQCKNGSSDFIAEKIVVHHISSSYMFNCANIHEIHIKRKLGQGLSKEVFLGIYRKLSVAVKMVTPDVADVKNCQQSLKGTEEDNPAKRSLCYSFPNMKVMKEILLMEQLHHPSLVKLLGYCIRSEESESTDLRKHGVVAVYEFGQQTKVSSLSSLPLRHRLKHAADLTSLLHYMETSPLGSLLISDFKESQFLIINNTIKMSDLDDINNVEPPCVTLSGKGNCKYSINCVTETCVGFNAKQNMYDMNVIFFKTLLQGNTSVIQNLRLELENLSISSYDLLKRLQYLLASLN